MVRKIRYVVFCGFLLTCIVILCGYLCYEKMSQKTSERQLREMADFDEMSAAGVDPMDIKIDFSRLQEQNPEVIAWIYIPGTLINYPILQSKQTNEDYYLSHNLYGEEDAHGCVYMQKVNTKDFLDPCTILYAHNMRDGSMGADLNRYVSNTFMEDHKDIYLYLSDGTNLHYQVFASTKRGTKSLLEEFFLQQTGEEMFYSYLQNETDVYRDIPIKDKRILALYTCADQRLRRVVFAAEMQRVF